MDLKENGQGFLRKNLAGKLEYTSFIPAPLSEILPINLSDDTIRVLGTCSRKLGELQGMLKFVPNASMYLTMYVRKEALLSAQIEGTQCTFDDILNPENTKLIKRHVADVIAYVKATDYAVSRMEELPLCMRLLREIHAILLKETRGENKNPGQTRTSQNWIGPAGCMLSDAAYVPPNIEDMGNALSEMETFINEKNDVDPIVKAALVHYQFETIHPFLDGNGRLGRLLITLSLLNDHALSKAVFYPSYQLKLKRTEYYAKLMDVRESGHFAEWIAFFCECLLTSAEDAINSLEKLIELRNKNIRLISDNLKRATHNGQRLLELLEENPIVDINFISERLNIARTTTRNLVEGFTKLEILIPSDKSKQRYRLFPYEDYLEILRQGSAPL